jgi:MoaA/NifB/PqqE/SkfB family radical SAM enzyme/glycosyltransferase involved in cell wall biosynthesis
MVHTAFLSDDNLVAITSHNDATNKLYGGEDLGRSSLSGVNAAGHRLAPWFSAFSCKFLRETGLLDFKYQTLEFFLCGLSDRLFKEKGLRCLSLPIDLPVDYRLWARDLLLTSAPLLASDFKDFGNSYGKLMGSVEVPPQFRVKLIGSPTAVERHHDLVSITQAKQIEQPLFSVICPAYKSRFFDETILSVVTQTCDDWELVVIVDGPPEYDREVIIGILDKYASDSRIRFQVQENLGTGPTRRRLAELAKGNFIVSLDDDDMFHCEVLDVFRKAIKQNPDTEVFRAGAQLIGMSSQYLAARQRTIVDGISCDIFEATQPFAISKRALAKLGGFDGDKNFGDAGEDSDLFLKIDSASIKTKLIDLPLYYRRLTTLNQTLSFSPDDCMRHIRNLIEKYRPEGSRFLDIHFQKDGEYIKSTISYLNDRTNQEVVTATRFFDYQTLGDNREVLIDLEITSLCNAVCPFCPREVLDRGSRFMSTETVDILAKQLSLERGRRQVILCGIGESTLHPKLTTIVHKLVKAGAKVCMTTNGSRLSVDKFRELVDAGMSEINFSLNAATATTHQTVMRMKNFARIEDNLRAILAYKQQQYRNVDIHASFVFCTHNQHEVADFVARWRDTPVSKIWIHPVNARAGLLGDDVTSVDIGAIRTQFEGDDRVLVDVFSHTREDGKVCKIVQNIDFISVDGDMLLCALDYKRSVRLGNLVETPLSQLHLQKFLRYRRGEINGICKGCDFCPKESL